MMYVDKINYTVYKHTSPSNKVYVGMTKQKPEERWRDGKGYKNNIYFFRAIQKYGWDNFQHEILYTGLTKEEAEQKEIELIAKYNSTNKNFGYNIDNGGNCIGSFSDEHKKNIGESLKGENNPMYGKSFSKEHRLKISQNNARGMLGKHQSELAKRKLRDANIGKHHSQNVKLKISESLKGENNPMYGKCHPKEIRKKMSDSHKIPIKQYSKDGSLIKIWDSAKDAGIETGVNIGSITQCCKGKQKSAGGYIWRYKN